VNRVKVTVYLVSGAWSLALLIAGVRLPGIETKVLGYLPLVIVALFALFDQWAWRWKILRKIVRRPDLNGTWRGELVSMRPNEDGVEITHEPKPAFLSIKQSYLTVNIRLMSDESKSGSYAATLQPSGSDSFAVYYHFTNTPDLKFRDGSRPHDGAAKILVSGLEPVDHTGEYWTDRRSRGTWTAKRFTTDSLGTYDEAVAVYESLDR
jgi:hypothetical protein